MTKVTARLFSCADWEKLTAQPRANSLRKSAFDAYIVRQCREGVRFACRAVIQAAAALLRWIRSTICGTSAQAENFVTETRGSTMSIGPDYLTKLREGLTMLRDQSAQIIQRYEGRPVAGSRAENELAESRRPESIETAWSLGTLLLVAGADHISALTKTLVEPVEATVCWTCVRSMLEPCALSAWFFDPTVDAHTRIGRVFAHRYVGLKEQVKFGNAVQRPATEIQVAKDRVNLIEADALAAGFSKVVDKNGEMDEIGRRMPSATNLIGEVLGVGEGANYRLMSAVAHGHHWAYVQLIYKTVSGDVDISGVSLKTLQTSDDAKPIAFLGIRAMNAMARPIWNQARYFGWNESQVEELLETVADKLRASTAPRFWRS